MEKALFGEMANPLLKAATHFFTQGAGNVAGSAMVRGLNGQPLTPTMQGTVQDFTMALAGALSAAREQAEFNARVAVAKQIMAGTHPDVKLYDAVAESTSPAVTGGQKSYATTQAEAMRANAGAFLNSARVKFNNTDGNPTPTARDEKIAAADFTRPITNTDPLDFMMAKASVTRVGNNTLEMIDKQDDNTQNYEHNPKPSADQLSQWTAQRFANSASFRVERKQQPNIETNPASNGKNQDAIALRSTREGGEGGVNGYYIGASKPGGSAGSHQVVDAESTKSNIDQTVGALQKRIDKSGLNITPDSHRYGSNALAYDRVNKVLHINRAQVMVSMGNVAALGKNPKGWFIAAMREELTHHEIHLELSANGANADLAYANEYDLLSMEQKAALKAVYSLPDVMKIQGRDL